MLGPWRTRLVLQHSALCVLYGAALDGRNTPRRAVAVGWQDSETASRVAAPPRLRAAAAAARPSAVVAAAAADPVGGPQQVVPRWVVDAVAAAATAAAAAVAQSRRVGRARCVQRQGDGGGTGASRGGVCTERRRRHGAAGTVTAAAAAATHHGAAPAAAGRGSVAPAARRGDGRRGSTLPPQFRSPLKRAACPLGRRATLPAPVDRSRPAGNVETTLGSGRGVLHGHPRAKTLSAGQRRWRLEGVGATTGTALASCRTRGGLGTGTEAPRGVGGGREGATERRSAVAVAAMRGADARDGGGRRHVRRDGRRLYACWS